jgi:hypothetical protein
MKVRKCGHMSGGVPIFSENIWFNTIDFDEQRNASI